MKVLIVDDCPPKIEAVRRVVEEAADPHPIEVVEARCFVAATQALDDNFDIVVLDIVLPPTIGTQPSQETGVALLELMLAEGSGLQTPGHVIGLTAFEDVAAMHGAVFLSRALTLLHYDEASDDWEEPVRARVRQVAMTQHAVAAADGRRYDADLAIVTAVQRESDAVHMLPWNWRQITVPNDHSIYYEGTVMATGKSRRVVACQAPRMGMAMAAVQAHKVIRHFRPRYVAMVGIAAGIRGRTNLGDVVAADPCWDWGSGKWEAEADGTLRLALSPYQLGLPPSVREPLRAMSRDGAWLATLRDGWRGNKPPTAITLHIGPMASGASVLSDGATAKRIVDQHRQLLAIDMEAFGVYTAGYEAEAARPRPLVIKAIVDFADGEKDDSVQAYGAYVSAETLRRFVEVADLDFDF